MPIVPTANGGAEPVRSGLKNGPIPVITAFFEITVKNVYIFSHRIRRRKRVDTAR
jgi:hypothetical protein